MIARQSLIQRWVADVWNSGNFEQVSMVVTPDFVYYSPVFVDGLRGLDAFREYVASVREGIPDFRQTLIGDFIGTGDQIAVRWNVCGSQTGDFLGVAPTGKQITFEGVDLYRFSDEQIAEIRSYHDRLIVTQQLGMLPEIDGF